MLNPSEKSFLLIYSLIVCFERISSSLQSLSTLHYIAKPAIVISLIIYFSQNAKHIDSKTKITTLLALVLSVVGDILLMFVECHPNFFIGGLIAFLLVHLTYIKLFYKKLNSLLKPFGFLTILIFFSIGLFYLLKDNLNDLMVPVIIYMLTILVMVTTAYLRKGSVNSISYILVFIGALSFLVSDSLLALNKFYVPFSFANFFIMTTYAMAQLSIVFGIKKQV